MPIRARLVVEVNNIQATQAFLRDIHQEVGRLMKTSRAEAEPFILESLRFTPGSVVYPLEWTPSKHPEDVVKEPNTAFGYYSRQKAAYYATDAWGKGIPTKRSGNHSQAWQIVVRKRTGLEYDFVIENTDPDSKYIFGTFNQRSGKAVQQRFHKSTGWRTVQDDIPEYLEIFLNIFTRRFHDSFLGVIASFSSTRKNR